jgi:hypothetical protein|tara:strand:+ start:654 stop:932 length:279 start_codon:yes stop_codon:yes gene_type:complete
MTGPKDETEMILAFGCKVIHELIKLSDSFELGALKKPVFSKQYIEFVSKELYPKVDSNFKSFSSIGSSLVLVVHEERAISIIAKKNDFMSVL